MGIVDAATGHNPREERRVAKGLYILLPLAVLAAVAFFLILGQKRSLDPTNLNNPTTTEAPATPSDAGAAANPGND